MLSNSASKTLTVYWWGKARAVLGVWLGNTMWNHCNPEGDSQTIDTSYIPLQEQFDSFFSIFNIFASIASGIQTCTSEVLAAQKPNMLLTELSGSLE